MAEPSPNIGSFVESRPAPGQKAPDAFRTISEVSTDLDIPQHVLRFWEGKFTQIRPLKRGGGRRYYRPEDIELLRGIQHLLYGDGYTIKGVQKLLREHGAKFVAAAGRRTQEPSARTKVPTRPAPQPEMHPLEVAIEAPVIAVPVSAEPVVQAPAGGRLAAAAQLLSRLKAMRRDYDLKLQAAKNGRSPASSGF